MMRFKKRRRIHHAVVTGLFAADVALLAFGLTGVAVGVSMLANLVWLWAE